jgi:hypothetical protein
MVLVAFNWMLYGSDDGHAYALKVDNDYIADPPRGWVAPADNTNFQYPRAWWPRRVIGISPDGKLREAICASVDAPAWNGGSSTFAYRDSAGAFVTAQIIGRKMERWLRLPPPGEVAAALAALGIHKTD